jgi:hypothetical protein
MRHAALWKIMLCAKETNSRSSLPSSELGTARLMPSSYGQALGLGFEVNSWRLHTCTSGINQSIDPIQTKTPPTSKMTQSTPLVTDTSLQSVLAAADLARTQSLAILDLLDAHHASSTTTDPSSDGTDPTTAHQLALSTQQKKLTAHLAHLRGLNRKAVLGVRGTKQETGEARQEIDALHLQLQNLYYEQRHLRGEIAGCEDYEYVCCLCL